MCQWHQCRHWASVLVVASRAVVLQPLGPGIVEGTKYLGPREEGPAWGCGEVKYMTTPFAGALERPVVEAALVLY